jgi:hypothetical protein
VSSHRIFFTVLKQSVYYIHKICENLQNLKMLFPAMVIGAWNYPYCIFRYTKLHGTRHKDFLTIYMIINFLSISIFRLKMITNQPNATLFWKKRCWPMLETCLTACRLLICITAKQNRTAEEANFIYLKCPYNAKVLAQTICPEHQITGFK